jgi:hypothetical protein
MSDPVYRSEERWRRFERRFERWERSDHGPDYLEGVGFGVFLIAVASIYLQYPWVWTETSAWFRTWVNGPTAPPVILAEPIVLFFIIMGVWGLVKGGVYMVSGRVGRGLGDAVGALFNFGIAYMVRLYGQGAIAGSTLLPGFIMLCGAAIVVGAVSSSLAWSFSPRRD